MEERRETPAPGSPASLRPTSLSGRWRGRIRPYRIRVSGKMLRDVQRRLRFTRWPDELENADWRYGANLAYMRELADYWRTRFDWLEQERWLNAFPQYRTEIDGIKVHFVHVRGKGPHAIPLILTHGWPSSFWQYLKLAPPLTDPEAHGGAAEESFDVVIPSVPGFGFSDRPAQPGFFSRIPDIWVELMRRVGYTRFGAHGSDMGAAITEAIARSHPDSLIGIHVTEVPWTHATSIPPEELTDVERAYIDAGSKWQQREGAYVLLQGTKPQTLAYAMADSPVGLAAWIIEKFHAWSDGDGEFGQRFSMDDLLTNVMIYWATGTMSSSMRYYYDFLHAPRNTPMPPVQVPTGVSMFPKDLVPAPRQFAQRIFNVQRWRDMPRGGHFAAFEEPQLLAEEIREFFRPLRGARAAH